ncbi:hypothetical protein HZS_785 [Henneguya salminicola]|nr:hypothetical protein HZS_785 [Henneguya salminicola]
MHVFSKNYVNLNCQKYSIQIISNRISKELALQNKLDTFWRESISHFENIFLKYTQELKDLKNQQEECLKQTLNISSDQFMSYKKVGF